MRLFAHTVIVGALLLGSALPTSAQQAESTFEAVPREHWVYAALDRVERAGLRTGFPEGSFRGQQSRTRYELAQAVERVLCEVHHGIAGIGCGDTEQRLRGDVLLKRFLERRPKSGDLARLVDEFGPELKLLGASIERIEETIQRLDRIPAPVLTTSRDQPRSADYTRGMLLAKQDWANRTVTLFSHRPEPRLRIDTNLGLPVRYYQSADSADQSTREYITGHNEEVYRLILRYGFPPDNHRRWIRQIDNPTNMWRAGGRRAQVWVDSPTAAVPRSSLTVQLHMGRQAGTYRLEVADATGVPFQVPLSDVEPGTRRIEVLRGPNRSHLLFVRWRLPGMSANRRYLVLDTQLKCTLNERDLADPAEAEYPPSQFAPL